MKTLRIRTFISGALIVGTAAAALIASSPANAAGVATDVAAVNWGDGTMTCNGTQCSFSVSHNMSDDPSTIEDNPCVVEQIFASSSPTPTAHRGTYCTARITATFDAVVRNNEKPCTLQPRSSHVEFTSGVSNLFDGAFTDTNSKHFFFKREKNTIDASTTYNAEVTILSEG
ncbi:MAG TPA: hypothetical protein VJ837_01610, partial [Candidatus Paceibacterota bacterium]|nr:hypothetical protein [Candidatus Paceibacterota bacterium]